MIPVLIFGAKDVNTDNPRDDFELSEDNYNNYLKLMRYLTKDQTDFRGELIHEVSTDLNNCTVKDAKVFTLPHDVHVITKMPECIYLYHNCQNAAACGEKRCLGCENLATSCNKLKPFCRSCR
ncbi:MAG: hypothetical protein LBQ49_01600 [Rickettsiales bacterium]|nr:hypothetical protein [Rickettsiales bacterium]